VVEFFNNKIMSDTSLGTFSIEAMAANDKDVDPVFDIIYHVQDSVENYEQFEAIRYINIKEKLEPKEGNTQKFVKLGEFNFKGNPFSVFRKTSLATTMSGENQTTVSYSVFPGKIELNKGMPPCEGAIIRNQWYWNEGEDVAESLIHYVEDMPDSVRTEMMILAIEALQSHNIQGFKLDTQDEDTIMWAEKIGFNNIDGAFLKKIA